MGLQAAQLEKNKSYWTLLLGPHQSAWTLYPGFRKAPGIPGSMDVSGQRGRALAAGRRPGASSGSPRHFVPWFSDLTVRPSQLEVLKH